MKNKAEICIGLSVVAVILAAVDFIVKTDVLNLAGTQWILIGVMFGIYALYFKSAKV
jgi:hypothetical protein